MPSPTDEMFREIWKDFNIRWNFPNFIESIDAVTSKSIARRILAANILATNNIFSLSLHKLYHSIVLQAVLGANIKFVTVGLGAFGKQSDSWSFPKLGSVSELGNTRFASI
jgi:hypothetical protein